jgi:hypothetical protein
LQTGVGPFPQTAPKVKKTIDGLSKKMAPVEVVQAVVRNKTAKTPILYPKPLTYMNILLHNWNLRTILPVVTHYNYTFISISLEDNPI